MIFLSIFLFVYICTSALAMEEGIRYRRMISNPQFQEAVKNCDADTVLAICRTIAYPDPDERPLIADINHFNITPDQELLAPLDIEKAIKTNNKNAKIYYKNSSCIGRWGLIIKCATETVGFFVLAGLGIANSESDYGYARYLLWCSLASAGCAVVDGLLILSSQPSSNRIDYCLDKLKSWKKTDSAV